MVQNGKRRNNVVLEELNETDVTRKKSERVIKKAKHQRNEQKTSSGIFNVGHDDEPDDHSDSNTMQENTVENNVNCVNEGKRRHNGGVYHDDDVPYAKELIALQTKYQALREFRKTETECLLRDAKALALEEKQTYEMLVAKLKSELVSISQQAQNSEIKHKKEIDALETKHESQMMAMKMMQTKAEAEIMELQKMVAAKEKLIEAERLKVKRSSSLTSNGTSHIGSSEIENLAEVTQARKLLDIYRIVTSTEIRLLVPPDNKLVHGDEEALGTDVEVVVVDSASGKRFQFDMAIPHSVDDELEYVPSEQPSTDCKVPSYLHDELTFSRKELSKFMRALLDVVIRNKKSQPVSKNITDINDSTSKT